MVEPDLLLELLLVATPLNSADRTVASSNDGGPAAVSALVSGESLCPSVDAVTAVVTTAAVVTWAADIYTDSYTTGPSTNINVLR